MMVEPSKSQSDFLVKEIPAMQEFPLRENINIKNNDFYYLSMKDLE
jgi:hypothetical protein